MLLYKSKTLSLLLKLSRPLCPGTVSAALYELMTAGQRMGVQSPTSVTLIQIFAA